MEVVVGIWEYQGVARTERIRGTSFGFWGRRNWSDEVLETWAFRRCVRCLACTVGDETCWAELAWPRRSSRWKQCQVGWPEWGGSATTVRGGRELHAMETFNNFLFV
jgi:hypothetical protein